MTKVTYGDGFDVHWEHNDGVEHSAQIFDLIESYEAKTPDKKMDFREAIKILEEFASYLGYARAEELTHDCDFQDAFAMALKQLKIRAMATGVYF